MGKHTDVEKPEPWSVRRWKQLEELERLLNDCMSVDSANCIVSRLKRIERVARSLRDDKRTPETVRTSLLYFLKDHARYEFENRRKRTKAKGD